MRLELIVAIVVAVLVMLVVECKNEAAGQGQENPSKGNQTESKGNPNEKAVGKPDDTKKPEWDKNREKAKNERHAGGAKLGLFKKGAAFEMDRQNKAIRFQIFDILETKMDNTTEKYNVDEIEFNITKTSNDSSYGVAAEVTVLEARLGNNATVDLKMIIFRENGTITTDDGYDFNVIEGALKFNLEMDWPYETKSLDPTLGLKCFHGKQGQKGKKEKEAKGKKGEQAKGKRSPETYGFCESVRVTFSSTYKSDNNTWPDMPDEYPIAKMSEGSGWSKVTLRFKGQKIIYDPIAEVGDDVIVAVENTGDDHNSPGIRVAESFALICFLVVFSFF